MIPPIQDSRGDGEQTKWILATTKVGNVQSIGSDAAEFPQTEAPPRRDRISEV